MTPYILITGGAGFIGTNLAAHYLAQGHSVMVYDSLARPDVEQNLAWLRRNFGKRLLVEMADIRDRNRLQPAVKNAAAIFHFAAQVAVTTSLHDPQHDFEVNAQGALNLLEAVRQNNAAAPVVFTSTNKVYGNLADLQLTENKTRYTPSGWDDNESGISEQRRLDFYSPYGCSKGTADQYVLDYVRIFGLRATVFRMSCIYGTHQFGTEDQGWVAHFLLRAIQNQPITIYGNGKQVRDILFVDDLVRALQLAQTQIEGLAGEAFNIGGGVNNTVSLLEILQLIKQVHGQPLTVNFSNWRPGDQRYYVSDTTKFYAATNWRPQITVNEGLRRLYQWLCQTYAVRPRTTRQDAGNRKVEHARRQSAPGPWRTSKTAQKGELAYGS